MKPQTTRREFLTAGLLAGIAAGCGKADVFNPADGTTEPSGEKVQLLSVDGEVIEVDKAF